MIWGIDFAEINPRISEMVIDECFANGLICECAGRNSSVLKIMPPLVIEDDVLLQGLNIVKNAIVKIFKEL